jgi:ribosomal protein L9
VPDVSGEEFVNSIEDELMTYHDTKEDAKNSGDWEGSSWDTIVKRANDPNFLRLVKLGLGEPPEVLQQFKKDADNIRQQLEAEKARVEQIWNDLSEISQRPQRFAQRAQKLFTEWAIEEIQER